MYFGFKLPSEIVLTCIEKLYLNYLLWLGGVMVTVSDLRANGRRFNSQPFHSQVATLGKLFTNMCLCHQAV